VNTIRNWRCLILFAVIATGAPYLPATTVNSPYGTSYQVNVNGAGQNIAGDAANEPSFCVDPTNPNRMAVGWRQFDTVTNSFRQAGWAYTTNGGLNWTFPGVLTPGVFRSDPVLATDADGRFYYLSLQTTPNYFCELWRSTNGGVTWSNLGSAFGGDKAWFTIDRTSGPGRGNIYHACSPWANYSGLETNMFTRSTTGGASWMQPIGVPGSPYWGTLDVGPEGELFVVGADYNVDFTVCRSTNAQHAAQTPVFELSRTVVLGGYLDFQVPAISPAGLAGQPWIVVDKSIGPTRSNVYLLCSVTMTNGNPMNVMFARSTNGGDTWSAPLRLNDDAPNQGAYHWFGSLSVAPNGRLDACWNDTRHSVSNNLYSELYYTWSDDGGVTWAPNRAVSPAFNHKLGYPVQQKMGDYIQIISLNESACIVYAATFNGEEDLYFVRPELPIKAGVAWLGNAAHISWNGVPGGNYCVQVKNSLNVPWSAATNVACVVASGFSVNVDDTEANSTGERYYRVVRQP
jgi:hypothetical protein